MIRIDSNENPNGPGSRALEAVSNAFGHANRYPVREEDDAIVMIAKARGVSPSNIILGCGSGELLRAAVMAFTATDRALVAPEPTFEAPANFARFLKHPVAAPPVDSKLRLDVDAIIAAARGAGLVYFCNPNNPTASVHGGDDVASFVEAVNRASPDTVILIDEAYHEYVADKSYRTAIPIAIANPRVVVTRTFSKVFGMAGLRAGYAIGQQDTLGAMGSWLLGSNVNQLLRSRRWPRRWRRRARRGGAAAQRRARAFTRAFFQNAGYSAGRRRELQDGGHPPRRARVHARGREAQGGDRPRVPVARELRAHFGRHDAADEEGGRGVPHGARHAGRRVAVAGSESARRDERRAAQWDRIASATTSPAITTTAPATKYHGVRLAFACTTTGIAVGSARNRRSRSPGDALRFD
jgi:hypothetical protein